MKARDPRTHCGFTMMEMLIVVAVIAVLIAIAIPVFTSQLDNARKATDAANIRSAKAVAAVSLMTDDFSIDGADYTIAQVFQHRDSSGGAMVYVTKSEALSFNVGDAYVFQTTVVPDENLAYPDVDHKKDAALVIWVAPGTDGSLTAVVTSNAA